ncbi:MAG TPA: two-component regulator propeller domain-containing protein [Thermoanaerobaculia bacterium]
MPRIAALIVIVLLSLGLHALDSRVALVSFQRVAIPDDVPAHLTSAIAQDRQGLLWFGTQGGLVRYDGHEFRVFRSKPNDPSTLAGNYVRALLVASDGRLWIGSFSGGLSVFDPRTETFTRVPLAYGRVEGLAEDRQGHLWIASNAGLGRLDVRSGRVDSFRHDAKDARSIADDRVRGLLVDRQGVLWVGTRDGLQRWLGEGRGFERVAPSLAGQFITELVEDRRGRLWIGTEEHGAAVLDGENLTRIAPRPVDPEGLSHYWVYGFAEGPGDEMWVATFGGGVDVVDANTLRVIDRLRHDATLSDTIAADRIGAVFRDRNGVMWVGTWGEGIARHDPRTRAFRALRFSPNRPDGLSHAAAVRAMELQDGRIWVGTNGNGIDILDRGLRRVAAHRPNANDPGALADGGITCLAQGADGAVWVATLNSMLHRLRAGATSFERIPVARLPGGPIRTMAFSADGTLWAGAAEGMVRVEPRTMATKVYRQWPGAAKSSPAIESIVVGGDGKLWVGSDNGLYAFDPATETATRIAAANTPEALPNNWVPDLLLARDGRLWVGTAGGAAVMTAWDGKIARFDVVSSSAAEALVEDASGQVWVGPRLRIDPRNRASRELGPADGVAFRNFFIASRARTREGLLLFGSPEGLLIVDPRALPGSQEAPAIVATSLRVEGKPRAGATVLQGLELSAAERGFALDVAAVDFVAPRGQLYRYRLEGLDEEWTTMGASQRTITYSRLPPGSYVLRAALANRGSRELRLPVTVLPALHQTTWFRALLLLAIAALLYGAYRLRVRQLRARERALERIVAERTRELETAYARIEEASLTDPLTKLRNRRFLEQAIPSDLELAGRGHGELIALLVDLDHFKSVNDTYGHAAGDAVLVQLAELLRTTFRASDWVVRWGGEEFLIVVRFVARERAPELAEKLRAAVDAHTFALPDGTALRKTCSIGVAVWPTSSQSWEQVIDLADAALYEAKRSGRNAWRAVA